MEHILTGSILGTGYSLNNTKNNRYTENTENLFPIQLVNLFCLLLILVVSDQKLTHLYYHNIGN